MTAIAPVKKVKEAKAKPGQAKAKMLLGGHKLILVEPMPSDPPSVLADWVELTAFISPRGIASKGTLIGLLDLADDDAAEDRDVIDEETGELLDEAILESKQEIFITSVFDELSFRKETLDLCYPFEVDGYHSAISVRDENNIDNPGKVVYLFCLLATAIRDKRLQPVKQINEADTAIGTTFQICACLAAGGYTSGEVASFGFPRADGTSFLPALRKTFARFGCGRVRDAAPAGFSEDLKDGGIDIMAWRDFPDGMPSKLFLLGQCASGHNWRSKSVTEYIPQLKAWFVDQSPPTHTLPAMFIPFPFHHNIETPKVGAFKDVVRNRYYMDEMRFGIIFDRLRIAHFAQACLSLPKEVQAKIDGTSNFAEIQEWVDEALTLAKAEEVAA